MKNIIGAKIELLIIVALGIGLVTLFTVGIYIMISYTPIYQEVEGVIKDVNYMTVPGGIVSESVRDMKIELEDGEVLLFRNQVTNVKKGARYRIKFGNSYIMEMREVK